MVRRSCAVYEYVRTGRPGVIKLLSDDEEFQAAVNEFGLTYDAVKAEIRRNIDFADRLDKLLRDASR